MMRRIRAWGPGLVLILPSLIALAIFVYGFLGWNIRVSLSSWRGLAPAHDFVGLANYAALWDDLRFTRFDVPNIALFTAVFVAGSLALGFALATLLERSLPGEHAFRSIYLFPMAISFIATAIIWRWLLDNGEGESTTGINKLLADAGLAWRSDWFKSGSRWAIAAIALPAGWSLSGYVMSLFLAGMRGVPDELREAARVDGASEPRVFWHVVRPMLLPVLMSAVVILAHISLKTFDLFYAMDQKNLKIDTPALYMWFTTFDGGFYARGAAIAALLLVGVATVIVPYIWYSVRAERPR
jgi:glucose/mannose transport system permease protein